MERLTEKDPYWLGEEFWISAREPDDAEIDAVYERLKHYEDLQEAGRLVELPEGIRQQDIWEPFMALNCPSKFGLMEKGHCVAGCGDCWEAALKGGGQG